MPRLLLLLILLILAPASLFLSLASGSVSLSAKEVLDALLLGLSRFGLQKKLKRLEG